MKNKKLWLIFSGLCIILGIIVLTAGRCMGGRPGFYVDRKGIHLSGDAEKEEAFKNSMTLDRFESAEIETDYADVEIILSDRFHVDYHISGEYSGPVCEVENGRFIFKESSHEYFWNFGIFAEPGMLWDNDRNYVRIEIPKQQFEKISIDMEDGELKLPSIQADELKINNEYGNVSLEEYTGESLLVSIEDGDFSAGLVEAGQVKINNQYGSTQIKKAVGENLSAKVEDGGIRIDHTAVDKLEVDNEYGDVHLGIAGDIYEYEYDLDTEYGYISVADGKWKKNYKDEGMKFQSEGSKAKKIEVFCEDGDIEIYQAE